MVSAGVITHLVLMAASRRSTSLRASRGVVAEDEVLGRVELHMEAKQVLINGSLAFATPFPNWP